MKKALAQFIILSLLFTGFYGCGLKEGTPTEKKIYTSTKTLETAKIFRETGLSAAKVFWDRGLMKKSTKDRIVELSNGLQKAINSAADALEIYYATNGIQGGPDLQAKIIMYQMIYGEFVDLVMPYVLKQMEDENG